MRRRVVNALGLQRATSFLLAVALCACKGGKKDEEPSKPTVSAATIVVEPQAFTETLGAIGTVVSRAGHSAALSAPAAGRVEKVYVTSGQAVHAGETLVEMDQAAFQSSLESAQAALGAAQTANDRKQRLAQQGIIPRGEAEQAAAELAKAKADATAAARTQQLSIIKSPINGVVTRMSATIGAPIDPAQPIVEISDPSALDVLLSVTPTDAGRVHSGAKVTLTAGQSAAGEPLGVGSVIDVAAAVDTTTRSVAVRIQAPTTKRPLRIGETIFGAIVVGSIPSAIVVPLAALVPEGEDFKVFVVDANSIAHERDVKVGARTSTSARIIDGLEAGERVVTSGAYGVEDSVKVVPQKDTTKAEPDDEDKKDAKAKAGADEKKGVKVDAKDEKDDAKKAEKAAPKKGKP
jgi:membrane fusion protein (multidrug efflux system)